MTDEAEALIADFQKRGWKSDPMTPALRIARRSPAEALALARLILQRLPASGTFFDAILYAIADDDWPILVAEALALLEKNAAHETAQSVLEYASLQAVDSLHPHLARIGELEPNEGTMAETWPWRFAPAPVLSSLLETVTDDSRPEEERLSAWRRIAEARDVATIDAARDRMVGSGLLSEAEANEDLRQVGFEGISGVVRPLYMPPARQVGFPTGYFTRELPPWMARDAHPTWSCSGKAAGTIEIGGAGTTVCGRCGQPNSTLLAFDEATDVPGVKSVQTLRVETCIACLMWEEPILFYEHDAAGSPRSLAEPGQPPQFPGAVLKASPVTLIDHGPRWQWQDWGSSNSRENLNRVGGHPTWIQNAEYPTCPRCRSTMPFLFQLDSSLPTDDDGEIEWGSGGIVYAFWCDLCRVSALLIQCT